MAKKKRKFRWKKRNGKIDWVNLGSSLIALFVILYLCTAIYDVFGIGPNAHSQTISIKSGSDLSYITDFLREKDLISHPIIFKVIAKLTGSTSKIQTGEHVLYNNSSYLSMLKELKTHREGEVTVTFPEGLEIYKVCDLFVENNLMTKEQFYNAVNKVDYDYWFLKDIKRDNKLEGYLYPDTYNFSRSESPEDMLRKMLDNFDKHIKSSYTQRAQELGYSFDQIITLASVIEREATGDSDRKLVSSVFHNRLKSEQYPYLQSCATVQYVLKERKAVLSEKDTQIDSKYNTYKYKGLPIGPIASVDVKSIEAALYPNSTDYYFFGLNKSGVQVFSTTYEEHLSNLNKG